MQLTDHDRRALVLLTNVSEFGATTVELGAAVLMPRARQQSFARIGGNVAWVLMRTGLARAMPCGERVEITRAGRNALDMHERTAPHVAL